MSGAAPKTEPQGELSLRVLGQMDIAGGTHAAGQSGGRTVTVAVDAMKFHKPVHVGDEVTCYTRIVRTSISVMVEPGSVVAVWAIPSR